MAEELKPCPFCGGEAEIGKGKTVFWVYCKHCGVATENYETEQEAAEDWNKRPIEEVLNEQIGRFKKYAAALEKEVKNLRAALETILDASQQDDPCVLGIRVVAYEALKEDKYSD